jgi:hypothetical protein
MPFIQICNRDIDECNLVLVSQLLEFESRMPHTALVMVAKNRVLLIVGFLWLFAGAAYYLDYARTQMSALRYLVVGSCVLVGVLSLVRAFLGKPPKANPPQN